MTTPARQTEADRVELVYYWSLNKLGNALAADALELWRDVPQTDRAATAGANWLSRLLSLLAGYRGMAHALAVAYYRLVRALRTGYTPALSGESNGQAVSLEQLRVEFESLVDQIEAETADVPDVDLPGDELATAGERPEYEPDDDNDDIEVEQVVDIDELIELANEAAEEEAAVVLDALGVENFLNKLGQVKADDEQREAKVEQAHNDANNRQAAAAMRIMLNAARGMTYNLAETDLRIQGWVRFSTTGDPCGWCAMLISRGFNSKSGIYRTRKSALVIDNADGSRGEPSDDNKFHDNCRCVAVPIFMVEQMQSPLFDQNRAFDQLWQQNIKGLSGKSALTKWRRLLRDQARESTQAVAA